MVDKTELRRVPAFSDLPDDQIEWFLSQAEELRLKPGEYYIRVGDPATSMSVILKGDLEVRGDFAGETIIIPLAAGDVTGALPFSRMKQSPVNGRAVTESHVLRFPAAKFPELVQKMPELTQHLVGMMSDRIRETTRFEQQRDRLASLGKLSAGLAHELNNPASAAQRATSQLRATLKKIKAAEATGKPVKASTIPDWRALREMGTVKESDGDLMLSSIGATVATSEDEQTHRHAHK